MSLLEYIQGKLYYDGEEFYFIGSEGMTSYWEVYVDGELQEL